ncbi:unnamed protein product [Cylindrotheca closterium]|uniref:Amino acid transporter transmembrane domain-containing protein n=1 Tax=Cylindrotheca closterium TaxID=2856 RepID=A0AAD2FX45_9STRA|nr:unnamed protein product [Cylindrotheca closterium]
MSSSILVVNDGMDQQSGLDTSTSYQTFGRNSGRRHLSQSSSFGDSAGGMARSLTESLRNSLSYDGERVSIRDMGGQSSIPKSTANLIKNLVGAGVLALPAGLASFADTPSAVVNATCLLVVMGIVFGYFFQLIAKTCSLTYSVTFREVWEDTMGNEGASTVSVVNMVKPALGNLAYSMILADTFQSLFHTVGINVTRTLSLVLVTVIGILPLCLMKNLDALAPFSVLGTAGIILFAFCMTVRYLDGSYNAALDGRFLNDLEIQYQPQFGDYNGAWTSAVLIFAAMSFEAYVAHYNAPRFMAELKEANMHRFRIVVGNAFGLSTLIYVWITAMGFLTFGANCNGCILNNYSTNDNLATISRVAIAFSILFTYPITFMGFRDGLMDVIELPQERQTSTNINIISIFLLLLVTILAAICKDLGSINAVGGGTLATLIVFVFPSVMYRKVIIEMPSPGEKREVKLVFALMILGVIMGFIGVVVELKRSS